MKYFLKKLVSGALLMLMMIGSVTFPTNAAARYVIYVDGYMLTASGKNIFNKLDDLAKIEEKIGSKLSTLNGTLLKIKMEI